MVIGLLDFHRPHALHLHGRVGHVVQRPRLADLEHIFRRDGEAGGLDEFNLHVAHFAGEPSELGR